MTEMMKSTVIMIFILFSFCSMSIASEENTSAIDVVDKYLQYIKSYDDSRTMELSQYMHPEALNAIREMLMVDKKIDDEKVYEGILSCFKDVDDMRVLRRMNNAQIFDSYINKLISVNKNMFSWIREGNYQFVGSVQNKDELFILIELTLKNDELVLINEDVISLKKHNNEWKISLRGGVLWQGELIKNIILGGKKNIGIKQIPEVVSYNADTSEALVQKIYVDIRNNVNKLENLKVSQYMHPEALNEYAKIVKIGMQVVDKDGMRLMGQLLCGIDDLPALFEANLTQGYDQLYRNYISRNHSFMTIIEKAGINIIGVVQKDDMQFVVAKIASDIEGAKIEYLNIIKTKKHNEQFKMMTTSDVKMNLQILEKMLIEIIKDEKKSHSEKAKEHYTNSKYKECIEEANLGIKEKPTDHKLYHYRAGSYSELGEHEKAAADYEKAIFLNMKHVDSYYGILYSYTHLNKAEKAIAVMDRGVEANPTNSNMYLFRGMTYAQIENKEKAIKDYNKAIMLERNNAKAYIRRGELYGVYLDHNAAIKDFNMAINLQPKNEYLYYMKGVNYSYLGLRDDAIRCFDKAIEFNDTYAEAYYGRGTTYLDMGNMYGVRDIEKAAEMGYQEAMDYISKNPRYFE